MEWVASLRGKVVGLDTSPVIYYLEKNSDFPNIAEEAARLRASYNIRTPDSIQIATAIIGKASFFLTNDKRLPSLSNLTVLVLDNLKEDSQGA